jgi:hypothetical protein
MCSLAHLTLAPFRSRALEFTAAGSKRRASASSFPGRVEHDWRQNIQNLGSRLLAIKLRAQEGCEGQGARAPAVWPRECWTAAETVSDIDTQHRGSSSELQIEGLADS